MPQPESPATPTSQRRRHFRILVRADAGLQARLWKIQPGVPISHRPMPSQEVKLAVREISEGGLSVTLLPPPESGHQPPAIASADRLRLELRQGESAIIIEGRLRGGRAKENGSIDTGIQFVGRPQDESGRDALATFLSLVGVLRRADIRARRDEKGAA